MNDRRLEKNVIGFTRVLTGSQHFDHAHLNLAISTSMMEIPCHQDLTLRIMAKIAACVKDVLTADRADSSTASPIARRLRAAIS